MRSTRPGGVGSLWIAVRTFVVCLKYQYDVTLHKEWFSSSAPDLQDLFVVIYAHSKQMEMMCAA